MNLRDRVRNWLQTTPACTRLTCILLGSIFLVCVSFNIDALHRVCLSLSLAARPSQAYRLVSAALFHAGLLHIAFNMLAFVPIARSLEGELGTLQFGYMLLEFVLLEAFIFLILSFAASILYPVFAYSCTVGFSGVIFGLIVVDNWSTDATSRSILGLFEVPAAVYPWALLVFWQLLVPQSSFFGHMSGLLVGELFCRGWLASLQPPAAAMLRWEVGTHVGKQLSRIPGYVPLSSLSLPVAIPRGGTDSESSGGPALPWASLARAWPRLASLARLWGGRGSAPLDHGPGTGVQGAAVPVPGTGPFSGPVRQLGGQAVPLPPQNAAAAAAEKRIGTSSSGSGRSV